MADWRDLHPNVKHAIVSLGFHKPTPVQKKAIPLIQEGSDVVIMSRTGSGKTAAFSIPVVNVLESHSEQVGIRAVFLSPTRDLALQTAIVVRKLAKYTVPMIRVAVLIGGDSLDTQFDALAANPDIVVATPGRLLQHMEETKLSLRLVRFLVLDEADRLFEMGMEDQIKQILAAIDRSHAQLVLASATIPRRLAQFTGVALRDPQIVRLESEARVPDSLTSATFLVRAEARTAALLVLLERILVPSDRSLIFVATRHHVEFLSRLLTRLQYRVRGIFGQMDQGMRQEAVSAFQSGRATILIATDVAARGLDIPAVNVVINYDYPMSPKLFVHRVGRTARAGRAGKALSLCAPVDDLPYALDTALFLGRPVLFTVPREADNPFTAAFDCFGSIPIDLMDDASDTLARTLREDGDLTVRYDTMKKSYGAYYKSRQAASKQSLGRVHEMREMGQLELPHPLFVGPFAFHKTVMAHEVPQSVLSMAALVGNSAVEPVTEQCVQSGGFGTTPVLPTAEGPVTTLEEVRHWRGASTIFEDVATESTVKAQIAITEKRLVHEKLIAAHDEQRERLLESADSKERRVQKEIEAERRRRGLTADAGSALTTYSSSDLAAAQDMAGQRHSHRDPNFFLSYVRDGAAPQTGNDGASLVLNGDSVDLSNERGTGAIERAVLDMLPDTGREILAERRLKTEWDAKRRRYVTHDTVQMAEMAREQRKARSVRRIQNGSGVWVEVKQGDGKGAYNRWMQKRKRQLQTAGERESEETARIQITGAQGRSRFSAHGVPAVRGLGSEAVITKTGLQGEHEQRMKVQQDAKRNARKQVKREYQRAVEAARRQGKSKASVRGRFKAR